MANQILVNAVSISSGGVVSRYFPGDVIADAGVQASIAAVGGVLAPQSDPGMAAAAVFAANLKAKGANEAELGALMAASYGTYAKSAASAYADAGVNPSLGGAATNQAAIDGLKAGFGGLHARGVCTIAVASLAAFTVADSAGSNDGLTYAAGDVVMLTRQATATQNGPYVVGAVTTGVAPLTRPSWFKTGATINSGLVVEVGGEGTVYGNTSWKALVAASTFVVDTTDGKFYPKTVKGQTALASGTFTISCPIFSVKSSVLLSRVAIGGTVTTTVQYVPTVSAGSTGITAGVIGTGAAIVTAQPAAGNATVAADTSTLNWAVINW